MAFELLDNRNRAIGLAVAVGINGLLLALLLTLSRDVAPPLLRGPGLSTFDITPPPPPPPPAVTRPAGASAPPSRGATKAPSPPNPPRPLPKTTPAEPAIDAGSQSASGAGAAAGSGAGRGGQGNGTGSGGSGGGSGSGATPPVHIAGALTDADYRRAGLPQGAAGTVLISFRVRRDGSVDRCSTVRSSGYAIIDRETCQLVEQRFRFRPARDSANNPIDFTLRTDFTWRPR
jgi:protein TonB|uniref:TonB family protein n=1 Tax=Altererythrobacter segetis TaxID=1104773 RepID=UPI00140DB599|nr:TonB family protein [Altererythrobacter segetis]